MPRGASGHSIRPGHRGCHLVTSRPLRHPRAAHSGRMVRRLSCDGVVVLVAPCSPAAERAWIDVSVRRLRLRRLRTTTSGAPRHCGRSAGARGPRDPLHAVCRGQYRSRPANETLGADELALRLVRGPVPPPRSTAPLPLGDALVDTRRLQGRVGHHLHRARRVGWRARAGPIGGASRPGIAHELVHALTGPARMRRGADARGVVGVGSRRGIGRRTGACKTRREAPLRNRRRGPSGGACGREE